MLGHSLAHVVARLRRELHPDVNLVTLNRPKCKLTCKQHGSRHVQLELLGVL